MRKTFFKIGFSAMMSMFIVGSTSILFPTTAIHAQQSETKKVSGTVKNADDGEPLQGASVTVLRTQKGVSTDPKGNFTVDVKNGDVIEITFLGRQKQSITYNGQTSFNVSLLSDKVSGLDDVVITGFQNIKKNTFTGSSVKLSAEDVKIEGFTDVSRMLEGRAAGITVQNVSGAFGSAPKIRIRGATSITGDNKPLWVVDGIVLEDIVNISNDQLSSGDPTTLLGSSVAGLNANDIESIDILKDAVATAMYGARAMNGVIVITSKKGKAGKVNVNYNGNFTMQAKPSYSTYNIMDSWNQMSVYSDLWNKDFLTFAKVINNPDAGVFGKMASLIDEGKLLNTPEARAAYLDRYARANTDWFDLLFQQKLMQEHNISMSSGTEKAQHYLSVSLYADPGWTIADNVKRYNANFNSNYNITKKLNAGFNLVMSYRDQIAPGATTRQSDPVYGQYNRDFDINPFSYALNTSRTLTAYDDNGGLEFFKRNHTNFNIIHELANNYMKLKAIDVKLQANLGYKIANNLRYDFNGAVRYVSTKRENIVTESSNMANAYRALGTHAQNVGNRFLYRDPDNPSSLPVSVLPYGGFYSINDIGLTSYDLINKVTFNKAIKDDHKIDLIVGNQVRGFDRTNTNFTGYGMQYDQGGIPFTDYRILKQSLENNFAYFGFVPTYERYAAFFATATYNYNEKYNLSFNGRYDGSNKLGKSAVSRWLPTWSLGGNWNIHKENFMESFSNVNSLILRSSYGLTASMGNANNAALVLYNSISRRPYADEKETQIELNGLVNNELTWEKIYTFNVGLDGVLFRNRLNFSVEFYDRKSFDLIDVVRTSGIGGEASKVANFADMKSYGTDVSIGGSPVKGKNFEWRSLLTFGYNRTKITNIKNVPNIFNMVRAEGGFAEGYAVRTLWSLDFSKLNENTGIPEFLIDKNVAGNTVNFQSTDLSYIKYEGPVDPVYTGGFNNTFSYKNLSLNVFTTFQAGNKLRLSPVFKAGYDDLDAMVNEYRDRYMYPSDNWMTTVPVIADPLGVNRMATTNPYNIYNYSTQRVVDGSFVRLKSISLTYTIPTAIVSKAGFKSAQIMASANNVLLLYADKKLEGMDPEFFNTGGVAQPINRQYTMTVRFGL